MQVGSARGPVAGHRQKCPCPRCRFSRLEEPPHSRRLKGAPGRCRGMKCAASRRVDMLLRSRPFLLRTIGVSGS
eukprot:356274-Chlamydomonas_euryale.AAC.9